MDNTLFTLEQYLRVFGLTKENASKDSIRAYYIKVTQKYPVAVLECQNVHLAVPITKVFKTSEDLMQYRNILCKEFNLPSPGPSVTIHNILEYNPVIHGLYNSESASIYLKKSTTFIAFLHEFAHHLHHVKLPNDFFSEANLSIGGHNLTFVRIYSEVMSFWNSLLRTHRTPADFLFE